MKKSNKKLVYPENAYYDIFGEIGNIPPDADKTFEYVMETLPRREAYIFTLKYKEKVTNVKIGEMYGDLSGERVRQIIAQVLVKLRSPIRSEALLVGLESRLNSVVPKQDAESKDRLDDFEKQFYSMQDVLNMDIDVLDLSARAFNCLTHAGVKSKI
jgi:hypothetical protein